MQAQTSQQCVVVSFDTYCMNARGKINIYDIPILSCNIPLDNPNLANLVSRQKGFTLGALIRLFSFLLGTPDVHSSPATVCETFLAHFLASG